MKSQRIKDLTLALDEGKIVPYFQPIVDLKTMQVCGFEVLARWEHGAGGATLPVGMIRLAEGADLIWRVTEALISRTAVLARELPSHLRYAINVSPAQFCHTSFAKTFYAYMESAGLHAAQVTIEITEAALLANLELSLSISKELKAYEMQIALDDFGTGYSSLAHLQRIPFDQMKIDGSLVNSISERKESQKTVAAMIGLSKSLGIQTVAEGVETAEQAEMLLSLGCPLGQGWLFSHPLSAVAVPGYLEQASQIKTETPTVLDSTESGWEELTQPASLQTVYDSAAVGLCLLDRNLYCTSLNRPFAAAGGRRTEECLRQPMKEMMPEVYAMAEGFLKKALQGSASRGVEMSLMANGPEGQEEKTYLVSYEPAMKEGGVVVAVSMVMLDITARKRAENTLRAGIDHYWRAAGANPQVPWTADSKGNFLDISPRWDVVTGLTQQAALGENWKRAIHPEDRERVVRWLEQALVGGTPLDLLCRLRRQDGEIIWVRMAAAARFGLDGKVERWYGTLEEIDAQKPTEYVYWS